MKSKLNFQGHIPVYLPKAVDSGRAKFEQIAKNFHLSQVHTEQDTRAQSLLLAVTAKNYKEAERASTLMYGLHLLDDRFDNPSLSPSPEDLARHRGDIKKFLKEHPDISNIAENLAKYSKHPAGFFKGLNRLRYGGLIQTAKDPETQGRFLKELKKMFGGDKSLAQDVSKDISKLSDVAYWMTTKVDAEFLESGYDAHNPNSEELWNLAYAPALYLHDFREEEKTGELNFFGKPKPTVKEMVQMIGIAKKYARRYEQNPAARLQQVKLL